MKIVAVGDAHNRPGQDGSRFDALGNFATEHKVDHVVLLGDFMDVQSLSSYEMPGSRTMENERLAMELLSGEHQLQRIKEKQYPGSAPWLLHYIEGNHEERIRRWSENSAIFHGLVSLDQTFAPWIDTFTLYRHCLTIGGITFTHVPFDRARPVGGVYPAHRALPIIRRTTVFGHTHRLGIASTGRFGEDDVMFAINAGCFFAPENDPHYMEGRIKDFWRGIVLLEVYDDTPELGISLVPLERLVKEYL